MLQNEYLLAKIGADPAENELQKDPKTGPLKDVNGDRRRGRGASARARPHGPWNMCAVTAFHRSGCVAA